MHFRSANENEILSLPGVSLPGLCGASDNCITIIFDSLSLRQDRKNKHQHLMPEAAVAHLY